MISEFFVELFFLIESKSPKIIWGLNPSYMSLFAPPSRATIVPEFFNSFRGILWLINSPFPYKTYGGLKLFKSTFTIKINKS